MAYKGSDLDLRLARLTPAREAVDGPAEHAWAQAQRASPIPVDEAVLAVTNCAYDVAAFHGADAVRLEHLLHALTRLAAGTDVLAELGVRVDRLRRDTAASIAAEMPAGPLEHNGTPRASAALEEVLRRATDLAARRRAPAGLHDVLRALLGGGPGSPAATLLMQAASDPQRLERWRDEPRREALASLPAGEAEGRPNDASALETLRTQLGQLEVAVLALREEAAAERKALADLLHEARPDLEAMRGLRDDIAADRRALAELVGEVRSELQALRSASPQAAGAVGVQAVESLLDARLGDLGKAAAMLAERLPAIEGLFSSDALPELRTRLETLEGSIETRTRQAAERVVGNLGERIGEAQTGLQRLQAETERRWASSDERQIALEASVRAHLHAAEEASKAHGQVLGEVHQALMKLATSQQTLGDNFATWRSESGGDIGIVSNRVAQLEQTMLDLLSQLGGELQALRQESHGDGGRRSNGFKRWLYGTSSVFASRREAPGTPRTERQPGDPPPS
ncbi:MAG TPA: hypothetical protein VFA64_09080 [Hyphomicrobiaceae bacterium]|nr:hypothetical protein [Hyphomicrobiaceae bacterium]